MKDKVKIPEVLLQLQRLILIIQRPPSENIRSFNVALMYNNAYIIDFLVEIRKKDHIVNTYSDFYRMHLSKSKMRSKRDRHQRYLNNGHNAAAIDTITSKCIKSISCQAPVILTLLVHHSCSMHCM